VSATKFAPPPFLGLVGHPLRWRLLVELARSDRRVDELVDRVAQPQSLVSYHLARLRSGGLVSSRRSSHDGRAVYYHARLDSCGASLAATGSFLHPGLGLQRVPLSDADVATRQPRALVLFACTGNSARSQIAEALLKERAGAAVHVVSAGSAPKPVHPYAVAVLAEVGIDISSWRSKRLTEFAGQHFDYVVTLCDKVRERCAEFDGTGEAVHWSIEDPTDTTGGTRVTLARFRRLAADIEERITWLMWVIDGRHSSTYSAKEFMP
jgi:ArsR family transcriptional regulator, arsenate/arsenite/antimonite-responsive transcriptional repressor / arsenate reductase (thioredoxin)